MNILKKLLSLFSSSQHNSEEKININPSLKVTNELKDFLENEVLDGLDIAPENFWSSFEAIVNNFSSRNKALLEKRADIQSKIDQWHLKRRDVEHNHEEYKKFLEDIGYIAPRSSNFSIATDNVDPEIKSIAGPQLVVPVMNARFALNAANARWGSLYDALYGTDVISEDNGATREGGYNPVRGDKVIAFAKNFLDETIPLVEGSYKDVLGFDFAEGNIFALLAGGTKTQLKRS
jgi:malate synthase